MTVIKGKVIITCAVTGAIHTPTMPPYLPITPDEIAREAIAAAEGGAPSSISMRAIPKPASPTRRRKPSSACPRQRRRQYHRGRDRAVVGRIAQRRS